MTDWYNKLQEYLNMECKDFDCDGVGSFGCEKMCRIEKGRIHYQRHLEESSVPKNI